MKRKLLKQIFNEWRNNLWLVLELVIVGGCLFVCSSTLSQIVGIYMIDDGYDGYDTYMVNYAYVVSSSPDFVPYDSIPGIKAYRAEGKAREMEEVVRRMRQRPEIEEVAIGLSAMPYNYNFSGNQLYSADEGDTLGIYANFRNMSPEFVRLLRIEGIHGESPEEMAKIVERGEILVSANAAERLMADWKEKGLDKTITPEEIVGRQMFWGRDSSRVVRIGGIVKPMKRNPYEEPYSVTAVIPLQYEKRRFIQYGEIAIRLKEGVDRKKFEEDFNNDILDKYTYNNFYVVNLTPTNNMISTNIRGVTIFIFGLVCSVSFLLVSIFLGLLGTFWFRTQQRVGEIAIRKVNGATSASVFRRLVSEGLMLVVIAAPFIIGIEYLLLHYDLLDGLMLSSGDNIYNSVILYNVETFGLLALMIVLGILFPARRAMKTDAAAALKAE